MEYEIAFHYDGPNAGKVIVAEVSGWGWTDADRGIIPNPDGTHFHVSPVIVVPETFLADDCYYKWRVNDVDNPTTVEML